MKRNDYIFFRNKLNKNKSVATEMIVGPGARFTVALPIVMCGYRRLIKKPTPTDSALATDEVNRNFVSVCVNCRPIAAGTMMSAPTNNAPRNRSPRSTVKLKARRK